MNPVQTCLQMAVDKKGQELLFNSLQPVRLRVGKEILPITSNQVSANELRQMVSQILTDDEKKTLFEAQRVQGMKAIGSIAFKFDFQFDLDGMNGSMVLQPTAAPAWGLPAIATESVLKPQGLNLIVGPRRSGKTAAVQNLIASCQGRKKVIAVYSDEEIYGLVSEGNVITQSSVQQLTANGVAQSADIVVIDSQKIEFCEMALQLAESGRSVVLTVPFWNIKMGLQRMIDLCEGTETSRARRLSSTLQMALGLRLLPGIESPLQGAFELLLADPEVQASIQSLSLDAVTGLMKASAERTGMRSLNQTLFQMLMKRKIELKSAFEASLEPEELDSMLKKVGI